MPVSQLNWGLPGVGRRCGAGVCSPPSPPSPAARELRWDPAGCVQSTSQSRPFTPLALWRRRGLNRMGSVVGVSAIGSAREAAPLPVTSVWPRPSWGLSFSLSQIAQPRRAALLSRFPHEMPEREDKASRAVGRSGRTPEAAWHRPYLLSDPWPPSSSLSFFCSFHPLTLNETSRNQPASKFGAKE